MKENYYLLFDLEVDPPVTDETIINAKIEERKKFWASHANDPVNGQNYKRYLDAVKFNEIQPIKLTPGKWKEQADEAKNLLGVVDKLLGMHGGHGEISDEAVSAIAARATKKIAVTNPTYKVKPEYVKKRASKLKIKVTEKPKTDYKGIYDTYIKNRPKGADKFKSCEPYLTTVGKANLYDFLGVTMENGLNESTSHLQTLIQSTRKKVSTGYHDAEESSGIKLCDVCESTFASAETKKEYDDYLLWMKRRNILEDARDFAKMGGGSLPDTVANEAIQNLTALVKDRKLAVDILTAYCEQTQGVSWGSGGAANSAAKVRICRICGTINDVAREFCETCGTELVIKCPKCHTVIEPSASFCKCGFDARQINRAVSRYEEAENAVRRLDLDNAAILLKEAKSLWDSPNRTARVNKLIDASKTMYGSLPGDLKAAVSEKKYYTAKKLYQSLQSKVPDYKDEELERKIEAAIAESQESYKQAEAAAKDVEILDICSKAANICSDNPNILALVKKYPPKAPRNINILCDGKRKSNIISWDKSPSDGTIRYIVIRKKGAAPVDKDDGIKIGVVSVCTITDVDIEAGVYYYYAVFAERAGALSAPLINTENPAVNLFEIENVSVTPADKKLQITWRRIPQGCEVEILRSSDNGDEKKYQTANSTGFTDTDVENETTYSYHITLVYLIGRNTVKTDGVSISGTPTSPPPAIDVQSVKYLKDDIYQIVWGDSAISPVMVYTSQNKPGYVAGDVVSLSELKTKMQEQQIRLTGQNTGTFRAGGDTIYVTAVCEKSGAVTIGKIVRAGKTATLSISSVSEVNGKITITLTPPPKTTGFVVLYRFDQFPTDISDISAKRKYLPISHYQNNGALILETPEQMDYYLSVFAEFKQDGESEYSSSADYCFKHAAKETITYSVSVSKKMLGKSSVQFDFEAGNRKFTLPAIEIYSACGRVPMFKSSGSLLHTIPEQQVSGTAHVTIPLPKTLEKNSYVKPFLQNENQHDMYELKMKLNTILKIS